MDKMNWVDSQEKKISEDKSKDYFNIVEGDNRIQLLSHCAPLLQRWNASTQKYEVGNEGEPNTSVKGVCWILQDGLIKSAKLPWTVVRSVRELMQDPDYAFTEFPMPRLINIKAKNAGTKEVEYTVIPSPKEVELSAEVSLKLSEKPAPEEIVERIKGKVPTKPEGFDYPEEIPNSEIPF